MRRLFEVLSGPLAQPRTPGVRFGTHRMVSFDGCSSIKVPDTARNRAWLDSPGNGGHPLVELMTLVETGTRALIGAVFGPTREGGTDYARRLLHLLAPDMVVWWDKGFDSNSFLAQVHGTGARILGRLRDNRRIPVLVRLVDGSYLSTIGAVRVRVVDARITVTVKDGTTFTGTYRLVTTLTDARRHPATTLIALYHQRWEHESAYYALRHTITGGRLPRSGDRPESSRRCGPCSVFTNSCAPSWSTPRSPGPAPIPTAAGSPSPCTPPATRSSWRPASSPTTPDTPGSSHVGSWPHSFHPDAHG